MDISTLLNEVVKQGLGVSSFVVLVLFVYKAGKVADTLLNNHLAHFQESMDILVANSKEANEKLDKLIERKDV